MSKPPPIPLHPKARRQKPVQHGVGIRGILLSILGTAALVAAITAGVYLWAQKQLQSGGYSTDPAPVQIIVSNDVLHIPANMIRFENQRNALTLQAVDLAVTWPKMAGYTAQTKSMFEGQQDGKSLIFITLQKRRMKLDMSSRLEPIYRKLLKAPAENGPSGLQLWSLDPEAGYRQEQLAISTEPASAPWVARCQIVTNENPGTCLRDIHFGRSISARYRFSREFLPQWRELEASVKKLTAEFLNF